jgi:hypothetical protein
LNLRPTVRIAHQSVDKVLRIVGEDWEKACPRLALAMDVLWRQLSNLDQISLASYWANFRRSLGRALSEPFERAGNRADRSGVKYLAQLPELARRDRRLARIYNRLLRHYFPKEIKVPVTYFSAEYAGSPLHNLGPRVELVTLPGGHWGCITTHVEVLAGHLRSRLARNSI